MSGSVPVMLGGLQLLGLEVPSFFDRGGRMRVSVHHVIGGDRVVQVLGGDPQRRELAGTFLGPDASDRGQLLEAMRDAAVPLVLTIGAWTEYVLLTSVIVRYAEKGSVVNYLVEAEALPVSAGNVITTQATVVGEILSDLAQSATSVGFASSAFTAPSSFQADLSSATASISTSQQDLQPMVSGVSSAALALMSLIETASNDLAMIIANTDNVDLVASASDLNRAVIDAQELAATVQAGGYVNRAGASIASLTGTDIVPIVHS